MLADGQAPMFTIEAATTLQKKFVEFYEAGKVACAVDFTPCRPKMHPERIKENAMPIPNQPPIVIRVSILRCKLDQFPRFRQMMSDAEAVLAPGIQKMSGVRAYFAGSDEATSSLSNVSVWDTLENAKQMDRFQPMLDLGKTFADAGATFERPIMNYATLWNPGSAA